MRHWLKLLAGKWRLWWNLCPACNSDAPTIDRCRVCEGRPLPHYASPYRPEPIDKETAWDRYLQVICDHVWTGRLVYVPGEPDDYAEWCEKCGMENTGSFVE
jgi:hypothetical protein